MNIVAVDYRIARSVELIRLVAVDYRIARRLVI